MWQKIKCMFGYHSWLIFKDGSKFCQDCFDYVGSENPQYPCLCCTGSKIVTHPYFLTRVPCTACNATGVQSEEYPLSMDREMAEVYKESKLKAIEMFLAIEHTEH